jgi:predicted GNAT family N-acyltransferase
LSSIREIHLADPLMPEVFALRRQVFVVEQGVPEDMEIDEHDSSAVHLAAVSAGHVIGTLRIVFNGHAAKIGRVAVSASSRKQGLGRELMEFAAAFVLRCGAEEINLAAQRSAREFYERLGYKEEGPVFDDAGLPHVMMRKSLSE